MTVYKRTPSFEKTHHILEKLSQLLKDLSNQPEAGEDRPVVHDFNGPIAAIQDGLNNLEQEMAVAQHLSDEVDGERDFLVLENRKQKELLESVLEQMPAGVFIVDVKRNELIMQNRQITEIFKRRINLAALDQTDVLEGFHSDGQPYLKDEWPLYRAINLGEVVENEEIRILLENGSELFITVNAAPIFGPDGKIDAAVTILFDVTERVRIERNNRFMAQMGEQLIRLEKAQDIRAYATRALAEYLHAARCTLDEVNLKERTINVTQDYVSGAPSLTGIYPFTPLHENFADLLSQGRTMASVDTALDPLTASIFPSGLRELGIYSYIAVPRNKEGRWIATLTVTDNKPRAWRSDEIDLLRSAADLIWLALEGAKLLQDLEVTTSRFNLALLNAPIMIHSLDRNLRYKWVYKTPLNLPVDQVLGKRYDELVPPEEVRELMELKQQALDSGESTHKEVHTHLGGEEQIMDVTLEPLRDPWGAVIGLTVAGIDITSQRRMEAEASERSAQIEIHHEILRHRELERMEVARDLHDGPLQELIGLNFAITEISMITEDGERVQALQDIQDMLQKQIQDLRTFCYELRPPALTPFGFERAVRSHIEAFERKYPSLQVHLNLMQDGKTLPEEIRLALYRAYQEALNNVARHSEASEVWIDFEFDDQQVRLKIRDNGKGFKVPKQWLQLAREGHLGMVGMHERVEAAGGKVEINSAPGQGTLLEVTIPRSNILG